MSATDPSSADPLRAQPQPLDAAALKRLNDLDPDGRNGLLRRVMSAFDVSLSRMLVQLSAELEDGNAGVVSTVAHTLKSPAMSIGALPLAAACAEVEKRLREGRSGDLRADIQRLLAEGEAALLSVRAMLRE